MAHKREVKAKARTMYVHNRCTIPTISAALDVAEGTLRRWKGDAKNDGDDWDIARAATTMAADGFDHLISSAVENFTVMFQVTLEQVQDSGDIEPATKVKLMASLSDAFNKMVNAAGRAAPEINKLGVATDVLSKMAAYIIKEFPQHADAFEEILEPFGTEIAKAYQ